MELDWDAVYSPGEKKEYFFLDDVLKVLSRDVPKYAKGSLDPNIINLRDKLWEYLTVIFDSNDLPVFLEILSREPGAPKVIEPNQQHRPEYQNKEAVYQGSPTVSDSHLGKDISSEQALNDAISIVSEDVNRLYNGMKAFLKAKGLTLSKADENQQKEACQEFYSKDSDNFTYLELEHVEGAIDKLSYWGTNNSARDIKGGLFQQFISHEHSYLFADKNLNTNYQDLYSLSTKLQKNVLKQS